MRRFRFRRPIKGSWSLPRELAVVLVCGVTAGCFLFPTAIKRETILTPVGGVGELSSDEEQYTVQENGNLSWELSGLRVEVEHMTDEKLNHLFPDESSRGKYSANPYTYGNWIDTRLGYTPNRFTVFKVSVYNRTFPKVLLNPLEVALETDQGQFLWTYGITSASPHENFENYYRSRRGQSGNEFYRFELRMGMVRSFNYELDQPIFKGENYGGYIVFDPVYAETEKVVLSLKNFVLRFGAFDTPVETRDLRFEFAHSVEDRQMEDLMAGARAEGALMVSESGPSQIHGNLPGDRTRDAAAIRATVQQRLAAIDRCFAEPFDNGEASEGRVVVRFTIGVGGAITDVSVTETTVASEDVGDCMAREVEQWGFRPVEVAIAPQTVDPDDPGGARRRAPPPRPLPVVVTYPFEFAVASQ